MNGYYMDKYETSRKINIVLISAVVLMALSMAYNANQERWLEAKRIAAEVEIAKARSHISATLSFGGKPEQMPALPATEPLAVHDEFGVEP